MTYATLVDDVGRQPLTFVEIELSRCDNTYGVLPCTASGAAGTECYNTRFTCQDAQNYVGNSTAGTSNFFRFAEPNDDMPIGIEAIPCIESINTAPTKMTPGKGLGHREKVSIVLRDVAQHDRAQDPYISTRTGAQGTWFGRLIARNPYYQGRTIRIRTGFLETPHDWSNYQDKEYIIESINGPDQGDRVQIIAFDVLTKATSNKAVIPEASTGSLISDIAEGVTSLSVTAGTGSEYPAPGYVRVGKEIKSFSGVSTDTLTGLVGAQWGTDADSHDADDTVQLCYALDATNVVDFTNTLLTTFAGISSAYIPISDWNDERDEWLSTFNLTAIISDPIPVLKVLEEITEQCLYNIWWNSVAQEIKLKALTPPANSAILSDECNFIEDSVSVKEDPRQRLSRIIVYTDPHNWAELKDANDYKSIYVQADLSAESADQYDEKKIKIVKSRWLNSSQVIQFVGRTFGRFRDNPKIMRADLDIRDAPSVGDLVTVETRMIQSTTGAPSPFEMQVLSVADDKVGHSVSVAMMTGAFSGRYGRITPNGVVDYGSATQDEKDKWGYIGSNSGDFSDGGERYKII